jgi:hypothetical protein
MTDCLLANEPALETLWMAGAMLDRLGAPEDFKAPIVFLLSLGSSFMTGADLRVDGGHCASASCVIPMMGQQDCTREYIALPEHIFRGALCHKADSMESSG